MEYKEQVESLLFDAKEFSRYPRVRKELQGAAQSITDLLARAEAAEARADKAERERDAAIRDMKKIADAINNCEKIIIQDGEKTRVCDLNLGRCTVCVRGNDCDISIPCDFQWCGEKER